MAAFLESRRECVLNVNSTLGLLDKHNNQERHHNGLFYEANENTSLGSFPG
jgi:hypothetical protein